MASLILSFPICTIETTTPVSPSSEAATFVSHVPLTSWRAQWLQNPCLQQNAHEITNRVLCTHEGLTQETFGGAEYFACNDLSTLSDAYFDANIGHAVMCVWNMPATSPFRVGGLSRHKGILRPEGLRGGNPGPLDAGRGVFIEHSHTWCHRPVI